MYNCPRHGIVKPQRERTKSGTLKRGKRPRQVSDKQEVRNAYLRGVKEALIYEQDKRGGARCAVCGAQGVPFDLDHIVGRVRGGPDTVDRVDNLQLLCRPCHEQKTGALKWTK